LNAEEVYAEWWIGSLEAKQKRQAEVLVPDRVQPAYIAGAYVCNDSRVPKLQKLCEERDLTVTINAHLYF
jgi:ssDNA thymidine ADP-ribosyltransferase, DarT